MPSRSLKKTVRELLERGELELVAEMTLERHRVLGSLVSLTFDADPQIGWRAIEAMGMASAALAPRNPSYVKEHMRRLYWLITEESGSVFWRAPESMAEVAFQVPGLLDDFVPIAFHLIETLEEEDLGHFRPGALWVVGRLGKRAARDLPGVLPLVVAALEDPDPQARGMAVWCLGEVGRGEVLAGRAGLLGDEAPVELYENRTLSRTTVGELAQRVVGGAAATPV